MGRGGSPTESGLPSATKPLDLSGVATIDALVAEYASLDLEARTLCAISSLDDLRDAKRSRAKCVIMAEDFVRFLHGKGLDAEVESYWSNGADRLGYYDRRHPGAADHAVAKLTLDGITYRIDLTASQFGYNKLPFVQREDSTGWVRL